MLKCKKKYNKILFYKVKILDFKFKIKRTYDTPNIEYLDIYCNGTLCGCIDDNESKIYFYPLPSLKIGLNYYVMHILRNYVVMEYFTKFDIIC